MRIRWCWWLAACSVRSAPMIPKTPSSPPLPLVESLVTTVKRAVAMPSEAWPTGQHVAAPPAETTRPPKLEKDRAHLRIPAVGAAESGIRARPMEEPTERTIVIRSEAADVRSLLAAHAIDAAEAALLRRLEEPDGPRAIAHDLRNPEVARVVARLEARGLVSVRERPL